MCRSSWLGTGFEEERRMTEECRRQKAEGRNRMRAPFCILHSAFCILLALTAAAQDNTPSPYTPTNPIPLGDTLLSLPTSHIPSTGTWEIKFTHRFNQAIDEGSGSDRLHSLFGLDSNADVSIGASWAVHRDLQFSLDRSNVLDDIELAAKYIVFQQAAAIPGSLAFRIGGVLRTVR